jgi:hypothetical protein
VSGAEIQGLLHPAQAALGYFLAWFQSLQSEMLLVPKYRVFTQKWSTFSISLYFDPVSRLTNYLTN